MDGDGDDSGKAEKLYRLSDDGFDLEKVGVKRSSNYVVLRFQLFSCNKYLIGA